MPETPIEWVRGPDGSRGHSINPIRFQNKETGKIGHYCEKISAGCKNCYASRMQKPYLSGLEYIAENRDKGGLLLDLLVLRSVLRRRKPTGYFWCDMSDLFGEWVPDGWIDQCFAVMALTPQHRHYVLTKRAERMQQYFAADDVSERINAFLLEIIDGDVDCDDRRTDDLRAIAPDIFGDDWPLQHVWLGVSAENQVTADERIPHLLATPAAVRFVSVEPLLGPVDLLRFMGYNDMTNDGAFAPHHRISWVIVGGESGPGARPMHPNWAPSIRDQCQEAGVPFFFKQRGEWDWDQVDCGFEGESEATPYVNLDGSVGAGWVLESDPEVVSNYCGAEPTESSVWLRRIGKKAAGRLLDGREWSEFPEVPHA